MAIVNFFFDGMSDPRLKPRLLRSLVRDRLPDLSRPMPSSTELSSILSAVKTHGLLAERFPSLADAKLSEAWRSAVDSWVDRTLALLSSSMPDKCWAGICLLGVTCEECSSDRFVASYSLWFQKLFSTILPPSSSNFVKLASCASLSDFFTRLASFPNLKKDATSFAGKVIQPILQYLKEDESETIKDGAVDLLCMLIMSFPSSMQRHYDVIEGRLISKIFPPKCNAELLKKFACCLAVLPKVRGDEDSWSLMMQKILIEIDMLLNDAFQGIEDENRRYMVSRLLKPPGSDPPPAFGFQSGLTESSEDPTKRLHELIVPTISALIHCCRTMLTNPYPVQVTIPVRALVALVERILLVNGSLPESWKLFTTSLHQELLCYELPVLHLDALDLLLAIIRGVRSQFLPHAANVVRILTGYFKRATFPSIRIKVYSVMQALLISMGVGMSLYLAQEVINNAFADLNSSIGNNSPLRHKFLPDAIGLALLQGSPRKRKHHSETEVLHPNDGDHATAAISTRPLSPVSVKIAALKALEALLTVGGALRSEYWRSNVDFLLITVATNACDAGWAYEGKSAIVKDELNASRSDFQLASLQALLASLLSPSHIRAPYLAEGLELFRRGKLETGTELAAFCAHALLALEVLIHPRALPVVDFQASKRSTLGEGFNQQISQKATIPSLGATNCMDDEERYCDWFDAGEEESVHALKDTFMPGEDARANPIRLQGILEGSQEFGSDVYVDMACTGNEGNFVESSNFEGSPGRTGNMTGGDKELPDKVVAVTEYVSRDEMAQENNDVEAPNEGSVVPDIVNSDDAPKILGVPDKGKEVMLSYDSDSGSLDSLPDIVDADPDTD